MRRMRHLKPREIGSCDVAYQPFRQETLYDATSGGSLVASGAAIARMEDVSGNGNHATQSTGIAQPTRQVAARNGMDAARFDGSNDVLTAGDVADMLANPVEIYAVFINSANTGAGVFGKSRASSATGRFSITNNPPNDECVFAGSIAAGTSVTFAQSTALKVLYMHHPRGTANVTLVRNAKTTAGTSQADSGASFNTTDSLIIGAYQTSTGAPSLAGTFLGGDVIECAKFSRNLGTHVRLRVQHAAMRRARIAG